MPITAPPNYSKAVFAAAIGVSVGIALYMLTRSTLPQAGDNIHSLPHGGTYCDGTKKITYNPSHQSYPSSNLFKGYEFPAFAVVIFLCVCVYLSESYFRGPCVICGSSKCHVRSS
ncbi:TGB2 [Rose virus C]|nr:triple gene block 2 [Rose virus C]UVJ49775.1 TGB2 [Rose virus C]